MLEPSSSNLNDCTNDRDRDKPSQSPRTAMWGDSDGETECDGSIVDAIIYMLACWIRWFQVKIGAAYLESASAHHRLCPACDD